MAGKRLLDAAKLFNAGRAIAKQHLILRKQQWDVYSETSTLAKAVKNQTDRVTVTAAAAFELAKKVNETGPSWREDSSDRKPRGQDQQFTSHPESQAQGREGPGHAQYETLKRPSTPTYDDPYSVSALRRREQQRFAESQIPSTSASDYSVRGSDSGRDTFDRRADTSSVELSSLPRTKLPKHADKAEHGEGQLAGREINQDVFYTQHNSTSEGDQQNVPAGVSLDGVFSNPRVSQMLGVGDSSATNPYAGRKRLPPKPLPEMVAAEERRKRQNTHASQQSSTAPAAPRVDHPESGDADVHDLAAAISEDTRPSPSAGEAPGTDAHPYEMRESRVPASRFGRLWQYGGLATSMAFGAVGESFRRLGGGSGTGSLMLSEGNMNRLVAKLSRMRGAALKLGQMMSFQDSKLLPPTINAVLQRVQDSADYMPPSQRDVVLRRNLGDNWRDLFSNFEDRPFAAASIGQVHKATLASNGRNVAVKVQYPGVRDSIDSDLNNLSLLLTASRLLPKGLYLDKTIANARVELGWECDYEREAKACMRFGDLVKDESDTFTVPTIYTEACGRDVLTAEFMTGTAVTKIKDLTQEDRDWVGTQILRLCLRELMEWRFMQTDPNWTNFLYNRESKKLELLDFGASRDFPDKFVEPYVALLRAASKGDRDRCRDLSIELGYLTGREAPAMLDAHVDSILTLAEPFVESAPDTYDFRDQTITDRVRANIGLMLQERLAPPPEETYSLHRKLSGAFLLCARLESRVRAKDLFRRAVAVWDGRETKVTSV